MVRQKFDWLALLCRNINCSQQFHQVLEQQLAEQAYILAGIDVHKGFALAPENCIVHYDQYNVAYLDADLIAPDNFGYPVKIAWRCETHTEWQIRPDDSLFLNQGYCLKVWWQEFPTEQLRKYSSGLEQPPFPILKNFSFEIEWQHFAWPEIWLELQTTQEISQEQIQVMEDALEQARANWNCKPEEQGIIHNWSGLCRLDAHRYEMSIDFGSANSSAISYWLQVLQELNSVLSVVRVIVRGFSLQEY